MKRYQSHQVVEAGIPAKIEHSGTHVVFFMDDGEEIPIRAGHFADTDRDTLIDGYVVRYADGHTSWSPRQAFEDGYIEVEG